jgi:D-amino peptidase
MKRRIYLRAGILIITYLTAVLGLSCTNEDVGENKAPRQIVERTKDGDNVTKILLIYDMEGVSGQNIMTSIDFPRPEYFEARELLTADINAVIEGLFAGGTDAVFVVDGHGSFNPEPDVILDKMDPRAHMIFKKKKFDLYVDLFHENSYDAIVAVAMHSKTGGGGFAEHTINPGSAWILNGMSLTESEILAYSWGRIGVPVIFVSGDDKLAEELSWMDWIEYVTVKEAKGIDDALLYDTEEVHKNLRYAAKRSVENLDNMKAITLTEPITATLRATPPGDLSILEGIPGIDYHDQSVTFQAADFGEAYDGMRALMAAAQAGYYDIIANVLFSQGQESFMAFKEAFFEAWKKSGSEEVPSEIPSEQAAPEEERLYFGSQSIFLLLD